MGELKNPLSSNAISKPERLQGKNLREQFQLIMNIF